MKSLQQPDPNNFEKYFVKKSSSYGPNVTDWVRSVYFSLMGSTLLTICLKANGISCLALWFLVIAFFCFSIGLICSLRIANRYKKYEKAYDALSAEVRTEKTDEMYYTEQELGRHRWLIGKKMTSWVLLDHITMHLVWLFAIVAIAGAGFKIESDAIYSGISNRSKLEKLDAKISTLNTSIAIINEQQVKIGILRDSLVLISKKLKAKTSEAKILDERIKRAKEVKGFKF